MFDPTDRPLPAFERIGMLCRLLAERQNGVSDRTDDATLSDLCAVVRALDDEMHEALMDRDLREREKRVGFTRVGFETANAEAARQRDRAVRLESELAALRAKYTGRRAPVQASRYELGADGYEDRSKPKRGNGGGTDTEPLPGSLSSVAPAEVAGEPVADPMPTPNPETVEALFRILEWCARARYEPIHWPGLGVWAGGKRWWINANGIIDMKRPEPSHLPECAVRVPYAVVKELRAQCKYEVAGERPAAPDAEGEEAGARQAFVIRTAARREMAEHSAIGREPKWEDMDSGDRDSEIRAYRFARAPLVAEIAELRELMRTVCDELGIPANEAYPDGMRAACKRIHERTAQLDAALRAALDDLSECGRKKAALLPVARAAVQNRNADAEDAMAIISLRVDEMPPDVREELGR